MIPIAKPAAVTSADFVDVGFDIDEAGKAHIFNILRNSLYTDKPRAVIREYSTNAADAHVEANCSQRPIEITLPNSLEPILKIRDFGLGLSEKGIQEVYCKYGASTKRGSNAFTGQLGLGCKSGFAYGENFVIVSYHQGKKTIYNAYLDASQIGRIATLISEDSAEENGVEIQIPVKKEDIGTFSSIARTLFSYFKVAPIVKGISGFAIERPAASSIFGSDWYLRAGSTGAVAVMGNIGYPISQSSLCLSGTDIWMAQYISKALVVDFPIGVLEIAANREGLQYTALTIKSIKDKLALIKAEIEATLGKEVLSAKTLHEAKSIFKKLYGYGSPLHSLNVMAGTVTFNGKAVNDNHFAVPYSNTGFSFSQWCKHGSSKATCYNERTLVCDKLSPFFIDDTTDGKILNRIGALLESDSNAVGVKMDRAYVLKITDQVAFDTWAKNTGFDAPMSKLSTLPLLKISQIYPNLVVSVVAKNIKHAQSVFTLNAGRPASSYVLSNFYTAAVVDLQKDSGVYILIDRFYPVIPSSYNGTALRDSMSTPSGIQTKVSEVYGLLGLPVPTIYCIKEKQKASLGPNFKCLFAEMADKIKEYIVLKNIAQKAVDRKAYSADKKDYILQVGRYNQRNGVSSSFVNDIVTKYIKMENDKDKKIIDEALALQVQFGIDLGSVATPTFNLKAENNAFNLRYKMVALGGDRMVDWSMSAAVAGATIIEYVLEQDAKHEFLLDQISKQK